MSYLSILAELAILKEASKKTKNIGKQKSGFESLGVV
jgi:hypothetical protein